MLGIIFSKLLFTHNIIFFYRIEFKDYCKKLAVCCTMMKDFYNRYIINLFNFNLL